MDTIEVQKIWLETLAKLAKQVENDLEKYMLTGDNSLPISIHKLIGYASSAKTLLKYLK